MQDTIDVISSEPVQQALFSTVGQMLLLVLVALVVLVFLIVFLKKYSGNNKGSKNPTGTTLQNVIALPIQVLDGKLNRILENQSEYRGILSSIQELGKDLLELHSGPDPEDPKYKDWQISGVMRKRWINIEKSLLELIDKLDK